MHRRNHELQRHVSSKVVVHLHGVLGTVNISCMYLDLVTISGLPVSGIALSKICTCSCGVFGCSLNSHVFIFSRGYFKVCLFLVLVNYLLMKVSVIFTSAVLG